MKKIALIFPNQLFEIQKHPALLEDPDEIYLIEDSLFFGDPHVNLPFHKIKLVFHVASMRAYFDALKEVFPAKKVSYIECSGETIGSIITSLGGDNKFIMVDPVDYLLEKRIKRVLPDISFLQTLLFINTKEDNANFCKGRKTYLMHHFYVQQRRRLDILVDSEGGPLGDKWSFDHENRKKVPKKLYPKIPKDPEPSKNKYVLQAKESILKKFPENPGGVNAFWYPVTHLEAKAWFEDFLAERFSLFGDYEDALVSGKNILYHSVLSPMINSGLLDPVYVVSRAGDFAEENKIPINSLEGFLRQIIGWREYVRMMYEKEGKNMRNSNYWNHKKKLPESFWTGTTGIDPVDEAVRKTIKTGYLHHIERLMVIGNIMFLLEIDPEEVNRWFMSLFIDSYDWVMIPNIYGMSQHAAGNLITTKPYISGSNYIKKMSDFKDAPWCEVWDALYWNFLIKNKDRLEKNHRMQLVTRRVGLFTEEKKKEYQDKVKVFTDVLWRDHI